MPSVGVRLALGATTRRVVGDIVGGTMGRVAMGAAVGWAIAAMAYVRFLQAPIDLVVFTVVPVLLLLMAALASWLPARRAARIDPVIALRAP